MRTVGRSALAILAGVAVAGAVIAGVEVLSSLLHPLPSGVDPHDHEAMRRFAATLPPSAFLFVLAAWALGAFAGAWAAARLAGRAPIVHGLVVGLVLLGAGVATMLMIRHPAWVWGSAMAAFPACSYAGARVVAGRGRAA